MNSFLLDTHSFLWWVADSAKLSVTVRELIADTDNRCFLSLASSWEIAIKCSIGKLRLAMPVREFIPRHVAVNQFRQLPITFKQVSLVETLPFHHRDPFDRLLIVQAMVENLVILSGDAVFDHYEVRRLW